MNVLGRARTGAFVVLAGLLLLACGGGPKASPMVADSPSDDWDPESFSEDAGAAAAEGESETPASDGSEAPNPAVILQANEDGARALLGQFVAPNADHVALTRSLRPTTADYQTLFDAKAAAKIEQAHAKDWDSNKAVIKPKPGQTEIKVWSATGSDLDKGTGNAREFPSGYKKVAKHLSPTVLFFRFKFVEPGKDTGTAYDGLAFVNGHWVIAPKPWRAMEGKSGGVEEDEPVAPAKPAGKKKPKRKKR